jgi:hypothetical protein
MDYQTIKCDSCESEYCHFVKAYIYKTNDDYVAKGRIAIDADHKISLQTDEFELITRSREASFEFILKCENCSKEFTKSFSSHKGQFLWH